MLVQKGNKYQMEHILLHTPVCFPLIQFPSVALASPQFLPFSHFSVSGLVFHYMVVFPLASLVPDENDASSCCASTVADVLPWCYKLNFDFSGETCALQWWHE